MFEELPAVVARAHGDGTCEAHLVFESSSGSLAYADDDATTLFALQSRNGDAIRAADIVPELVDRTPREFSTRLTSAAREVDAIVRVAELKPGNGAGFGATLVVVRARANAHERERDERLEALWSLVVGRGFSGGEQIRALLRESARGIGLDAATVYRVASDELVVEFRDDEDDAGGGRLPIADSFAASALAGTGTFAVLDARRAAGIDAAAQVGCHLLAAFRALDEQFVLAYASPIARERPFEPADWSYVEHVALVLARAIERRDHDVRIRTLAYRDALTSLPNRVALLARLDDAIATSTRDATRTGVLFVDIDGFKLVNDTVGHRGGDQVLTDVAHRMRETLRREEYIGRLGGDEFAVVVPDVADRAEVEAIAHRIGAVLGAPFDIDDARFSLSASTGIALFPDDARSREDLLASADMAMYRAKELGAQARTLEPADVAIRYQLCYQPILDAATGRITGAEALIRRVHPQRGLLAPERGWSIASDPAGRRELDRFVLREAAMQAHAWDHAGTPMRIDVNLAGFDTGDIDALLADDALGAEVRRLRIEIGAARLTGLNGESLAAFVEHCAANGMSFSLDGFDGGLGALSALANLPIEAIKLDRPLVEGTTHDRTLRAIAEGTIIVARSLGWSVIAKGVETDSQQEAVVTLGCDGIQGFLVAHPMTAAEFGVWLRDRRIPVR